MPAAPALHRPLMAFSSCRHTYPLPAKSLRLTLLASSATGGVPRKSLCPNRCADGDLVPRGVWGNRCLVFTPEWGQHDYLRRTKAC